MESSCSWNDSRPCPSAAAEDAGSQLDLEGTTFTATGAGAHGIALSAGGAVTAKNITVSAKGTDASALFIQGDGTTSSTATFSGGSLTSQAAPAVAVAGTAATVSLTDAIVTAPDTWLRVAGASAFTAAARHVVGGAALPVSPDGAAEITALPQRSATVRSGAATAAAVLDISHSTLTGAAITDAGSTSQVTLRNGTLWNLTGNSNLTSLTLDASQIEFAVPAVPTATPAAIRAPLAVLPASVFKTLTVANYVGAGGTIGLNTVLAGDGAPSDKVVISGGTASGTTGLRITNADGGGALTTANGILVVDAVNGGTTAPGAFALDGRAVAGVYEYRLFRGSTDASNANAWYLRSEQIPTPPTPPAPPEPPKPLYRPEVAAYLANQRLAGQMFVHSLHDRLGEPQYVEGQGFNPAEDKPRSGWLRMVGKWEGSKSQDGNFKTSTDSFLLHGGAELARWSLASEADRLHAGLMGSYGYASTDAEASGNPFRAKGKVEGWSVGAYGTWFQNDEKKLGAYVDTWFQYGWFNNRVEGDLLPTVRYHAQGWSVSGETGYAMPLRNDWVVEPQAQLIYVGYSEDDITEPNGTRVSGADSNGIIARLGVRLHRTFVREGARKLQPYATINWWHTSTDSNISFNQLPLGGLYPQNRYELKVGVNADLGKRWTGWGNVSGAWGQQSFYQYALRVGVKYSW